jgi:hypothetical protein
MGLSAAGAGDGGIGAAAADGFEVFVRQFCCEAILHFDEIHFFLHFSWVGCVSIRVARLGQRFRFHRDPHHDSALTFPGFHLRDWRKKNSPRARSPMPIAIGAVLVWEGCRRDGPLCDRRHRLARETNPRWPRWLKGPVQSKGDVYAKIFAIQQNDQATQRAV